MTPETAEFPEQAPQSFRNLHRPNPLVRGTMRTHDDSRGPMRMTRDGLTRALKSPFVPPLDAERVRVRAYFRSQANGGGDPVGDWLTAETDEALELVGATLMHLPADEGAPAGAFDDQYELVSSVSFVSHEPKAKDHIGSRAPRRCTLCDGTTPTATFRTDAHVLPEAFGSRWLLTFDECDACNTRFGKALENELAAMLILERVIARLPTKRRSSAKLKMNETASSVGGQGREEPLLIEIRDDEGSVTATNLGPNSFALGARVLPYHPASALRSLGRTAWHLMPAASAEKSDAFRAWLKGERAVFPLTLRSVFLPGRPLRRTTFAVWRALAPGIPEIVVAFAFGHTFLCWSAPDWATGRSMPGPLPPCPRPFAPPGASLNMRTQVFKSDDKIRPGAPSYEIQHLERALAWSRDPQPVVVAVSGSRGVATLNAICVTPGAAPNTTGIYDYVIRGGDLVGTLRLSRLPVGSDAEGVHWNVRFSFEPPDEDGASVEKTLAVVVALLSGGGLRVATDPGGETVATLPPGEERAVDDAEIELRLRVSAAVGVVNRTFGTGIQLVPEEPFELDDGREAVLLAAAIAGNGRVSERGELEMQLPVRASAVDALLAALDRGPQTIAFAVETPCRIFGITIDPGRRHIELDVEALLDTPDDVVTRARAAPAESIAVSVRCSEVRHRYERWSAAAR